MGFPETGAQRAQPQKSSVQTHLCTKSVLRRAKGHPGG